MEYITVRMYSLYSILFSTVKSGMTLVSFRIIVNEEIRIKTVLNWIFFINLAKIYLFMFHCTLWNPKFGYNENSIINRNPMDLNFFIVIGFDYGIETTRNKVQVLPTAFFY